MAISQLSVFVENKAGALAEITEILAAEGIDLHALSISETQDFGILRIISSDNKKAMRILRNRNCIVNETNVFAVSIPDEPGGFAHLLRVLADNSISIEYTYVFITKAQGEAYVVLRIENMEEADHVFIKNGIRQLSEAEII